MAGYDVLSENDIVSAPLGGYDVISPDDIVESKGGFDFSKQGRIQTKGAFDEQILTPQNSDMPANPQEALATNPGGIIKSGLGKGYIKEGNAYDANGILLGPAKPWDVQQFATNDVPNVIKAAPSTFMTGLAKTTGGLGQFLSEDTSGDTESTLYGFDESTKRPGFGMLGNPTELNEESKSLIAGSKLTEEEIQKQFPINTYGGKMLNSAVTSVLQQGPSLVLSTVAGQPAWGLAVMGIQSFGTQYAEDRAKGMDPTDAAGNAGVQLITEPGTEILPFVKFAKGMKQGWSTKVLREFVLGEQAGEHVAQAVEGAFDVYFNEKNPKDRVDAAINYLKSAKHLDDQKDVFWTTLIQSGLMGMAGKGFNKALGHQDLSEKQESEFDHYNDVKASATMYETMFGKPAPVQPVKPTWLNDEAKPFLPKLGDFTPEAINPEGIGAQGGAGSRENDKAWERFATPEESTPIADHVEVPDFDGLNLDQAISASSDIVAGAPVGSKAHQEDLLNKFGGSDATTAVTPESAPTVDATPQTQQSQPGESVQPVTGQSVSAAPVSAPVESIISQAQRAVAEGKDYPAFAKEMSDKHGFDAVANQVQNEGHAGLNDAFTKAQAVHTEQQAVETARQEQIATLTAQANNIAIPQKRRDQAREALERLQSVDQTAPTAPPVVEPVNSPVVSGPSPAQQGDLTSKTNSNMEQSVPEAKLTVYRTAVENGKAVRKAESVALPADEVVKHTTERKSMLESLLDCIGGH